MVIGDTSQWALIDKHVKPMVDFCIGELLVYQYRPVEIVSDEVHFSDPPRMPEEGIPLVLRLTVIAAAR